MDSKKELNALQRIDDILSEFKEFFPAPIQLPRKKSGEEFDPMRLLKRVNGIIIGFNDDNAKRKVDNLLKFFDGIRKRG
ncbi:MAG: hypothetical protein Q8Q22_01415 [bacterium]|nr:hypothetical protein [bacterium]